MKANPPPQVAAPDTTLILVYERRKFRKIVFEQFLSILMVIDEEDLPYGQAIKALARLKEHVRVEWDTYYLNRPL